MTYSYWCPHNSTFTVSVKARISCEKCKEELFSNEAIAKEEMRLNKEKQIWECQ